MTSPVNNRTSNDWSKDPRWAEAHMEREAELESNRQSDHHMERAIDRAGDKHFGSTLEGVLKKRGKFASIIQMQIKRKMKYCKMLVKVSCRV